MTLKHKKERGITLIALVITIIVLLLLAGVSIATLTGDNGILTKAQTAKEETEKASEEEQRQLAMLNAATHTKEYEYPTGETDKSGKPINVTIPSGFAPTGIEGEDTVKEGFVITDENGNEFVWIPCTKEEFNIQRNTETTWKTKLVWYNGGTWGDEQPNQQKIQDSITNKGGFYIARYEAGIPKGSKAYANSDGAEYKKETEKNNTIDTPVSKKGVQVWNYISHINAKSAAEKMVSNSDVHSYLIDSHAWDVACRVIKKYEFNDNEDNLLDSRTWGNYYNNTTTKYENLNTLYALHGGTAIPAQVYNKGQVKGAPKEIGTNRLELSTGASDDFKAYNIYDLAGNMVEWTTETGQKSDTESSSTDSIVQEEDQPGGFAVIRGGSCFDRGEKNPVVFGAGHISVSSSLIYLTFRVVLYLQ